MSHFDSSYNEKAVSAGCLAVSMISHIVDINFGELDVILAVFWRTIARFLLGEAKRLRRAGFDEGEFTRLSSRFEELITRFFDFCRGFVERSGRRGSAVEHEADGRGLGRRVRPSSFSLFRTRSFAD